MTDIASCHVRTGDIRTVEQLGQMSDPHYVSLVVMPFVKGRVDDGAKRGLSVGDPDYITDDEGFAYLKERFDTLDFDEIDTGVDIFTKLEMSFIYETIKSRTDFFVSVTGSVKAEVTDVKAYAGLFGDSGGPGRVKKVLEYCEAARAAARTSESKLIFFLATSSEVRKKPNVQWLNQETMDLIADILRSPLPQPASEALVCIRDTVANRLGEFKILEEVVPFLSASDDLVKVTERGGGFYVRNRDFYKLLEHQKQGRLVGLVINSARDAIPAASKLMAKEPEGCVAYRSGPVNWSDAMNNSTFASRRVRNYKGCISIQITTDLSQCSGGKHVFVLTGDVVEVDEITAMFKNGACKVTVIGGALEALGKNIMRALGYAPTMDSAYPRLRVQQRSLAHTQRVLRGITQNLQHAVFNVVLVAEEDEVAPLLHEALGSKIIGRQSIAVFGENLKVQAKKSLDDLDPSVADDYCLAIWDGGAGRVDAIVDPTTGRRLGGVSVSKAPPAALACMNRAGQCKHPGGRLTTDNVAALVPIREIKARLYFEKLEQVLYSAVTTIFAAAGTMDYELAVLRFAASDVVVVCGEDLLREGQNQDGFPKRPTQSKRKKVEGENPVPADAAAKSSEPPRKRRRASNTWSAYLTHEKKEQSAGRGLATAQEETGLVALNCSPGDQYRLQKLCKMRWP